jgi:alcohol sulfotransferase
MMGPSGLPKVNQWLNEWAKGLDSLDSTLVVRYEDMRADTTAELRRIADFMRMDATDAEVADAVEWAAFENMKQRERMPRRRAAVGAGDVANPDLQTRAAKVGGYQDYFDDMRSPR